MARRIGPEIILVALIVVCAIPIGVAAREPGGTATVTSVAMTGLTSGMEENLTPLRGHEQVPILLSQHAGVSVPSSPTMAGAVEPNRGGTASRYGGWVPLMVAIATTCWGCALLAIPRKPLPGNEVAELVYSRLLGRQQRLVLAAAAATVAVVIAALTAVT
jgi:hypothetical protein